MNVENRLSCLSIAVEDRAIACGFYPALLGDRRGGACHGSDQPVVGFRQIIERGDVFAGNNQHMRRRLRVDIFERDHQIIFINAL